MALWLQLDVLQWQAQRLVRDRCRRSASEAPACLLAVDEYTPNSRLVLSYWRCASPLYSTQLENKLPHGVAVNVHTHTHINLS